MENKNKSDNRTASLKGMVERITFHNPENGFSVLKVKPDGRSGEVTVVGNVPGIAVGEVLEAEGEWIRDPRHGMQLRAEKIISFPPVSVEGMSRYLGSGMIRGIGPEMASRMVEAFGDGVFEIIENHPQRLTEVPGIGRKRREMISGAWQEQKKVRSIMLFLHSHGVGSSRAHRIYKQYGDQAVGLIKENPYRLFRDIWGIGFKTADGIAASLGIPPDSLSRACAGIEYTLDKYTEDGHCACPRDKLEQEAVELLGIPPEIISEALDRIIGEGRLVTRQHGSSVLVYPSRLNRAEEMLAADLQGLLSGGHPSQLKDPGAAVKWVQEQVGIRLDESQERAIHKALSSKVLVITGGPGVGKTTIVNSIVRIFRAAKLQVQLCAPTGRAAKRLGESTGMEARTIHRMLEFDPVGYNFTRNRNNPLDGDVIICDEFSMVDLPLAHQLIRAVPPHAALLIVGDVDQLPSVGPGRVLRDIIDSSAIPVVRLTKVFRQAAKSSIITNAHLVNSGKMPRFDNRQTEADGLNDFYHINSEEPEKGVELIKKLVQERIPRRWGFDPIRDIQVLCPMVRGLLGAHNLNFELQALLNPAGPSFSVFGSTFRTGDKVMQILNNYDKNVFNGDIGIITAIDEVERGLAVRVDGRQVFYEGTELDERVLSYAVTIHKSQGSEYPCVVIPFHTQHYPMMQRNLLYTGITRGKKLVILVGNRKALAIAVKRTGADERLTTLSQRLAEAGHKMLRNS